MPVYLLRTWAYHFNLGLASTKEQAAVLTAYATVLNETIASGDLAAARKACALARPPYEQVEGGQESVYCLRLNAYGSALKANTSRKSDIMFQF
jgi:hypothetical protein